MTTSDQQEARPDKLHVMLDLSCDQLNRMEQLLYLYKAIKGRSLNKSDFVSEAVEEKFQRDIRKPVTQIINQRQIRLKLTRKASDEADRLLSALRSAGVKINKCEWITQAIAEKIEQDESTTFGNLEDTIPFDATHLH